MSKEYEQAGEHSWCTDFAYQVMDTTKGADSLSLLKALMTVEGSVAEEAFLRLGLDLPELRKELAKRRRELGEALDSETWVVAKATQRAKNEGFPLSTDHLLEVIWDEECEGSRWLSGRVDADLLEEALNVSRYPDEGDSSVVALPLSPVPPAASGNKQPMPKSRG